jgi:hypothetical protein
MAASDYMGAVRPPNSADWAAPLVGIGLGDRLASLPERYGQGADVANKLAMQNAFPNGIPLDASGQPDIAKIMDITARTGGVPMVQPLLNMMMYTRASDQASQAFGQPSPPSPYAQPQGAQAQPQAAAQPQQPAGAKTVGQYLREAGFSNQEITKFASDVGISPGAIMAGGVQSKVTDALGNWQRGGKTPAASSTGQAGEVTQGQGGDTAGASETNQPARTASATDAGINYPQRSANDTADTVGSSGAPTAAVGGASGSPAPIGGPAGGTSGAPASMAPFMAGGARQDAEPAAGGGSRMAQAQPGANLDPLRKLYPNAPNPTTAAYGRLAQIDQEIARLSAAGVSAGKFNPAAATMAKARIDPLDAERKTILDALKDAGALTSEQKNLQSGAAQEDLRLKSQQKRSDAVYGGITAQASQYERDLKPLNQLARSILNNPDMYTGIGANAALNWNKIAAIYGNNRAAMLQEALKKVTAGSVLAQLNTQRDQLQEAGSNSSRIFSAQVDLVQQAATEAGITLGGNRFLVETSDRLGNLSLKVAQMAREYMAKNGVLDVGFDQKLSDYMTKNPVFTDKELSHPEWIGAPTIPPAIKSKPALAAWERSMGLKSGDVIRTPKGDYVAVP